MSENLYRRGSVWWACVKVRGRRIRKSLHTTSKTEAKERLKAVLEQASHFRFHGENRHTWQEAVVEWAKAPGVRPKTATRYVSSLRQVDGILGKLYIDEIGVKHIAKIAHRGGVSNATKRRDLTVVSVVLRACVGWGWIDSNPAIAYDRRVIPERRDPIVLPEQWAVDAAIAEAPGNFARMIAFACQTGMRQEEIGSLEHSQVNLKRRAVDLTRTKTDRPRSVPLDERAEATIRATVRSLKTNFVFWHDPGERYHNISSRFGEIMRRLIQKRKAAKLPVPRRFRFHDLRHLYAVNYLRQGGNIYTLQKILGHSSIKTTELYLDYLTPDEQERAKNGPGLQGATERTTVATV